VSKQPDTTIPADETDDIAAREGRGIRWIFPASDGACSPFGAGLLLGRGEECDVQLASGETSRQHARISREGPLWVIRDLESRNGTFVNGKRVASAPLGPGDLLRLGDSIGVVVPELAAPGAFCESFLPGLYGGPTLRSALELGRRAATSALPIIVEGETGTGKEGLSRALHAWSGRPGAFVAVNCGAIPEALAEGELFGYRKGAFTGADRPHPGHFRAASGGTMLLDEIIELPPALQTKLLRVIEQRELVPLGESAPVPIDVRIVVAAQESLAAAVKDRRFRADLYARLNGVTLRLPPLRERREEIPFLVTRLLADHAGGRTPQVEARAIERLCLYDWPFNLRELDLLVRRLLVLHPDGQVKKSDLPDEIRNESEDDSAPPARPAPVRPRTPEARADRDREDLAALVTALRVHGGNVVRAAGAAGMTRQRAYRLMGQSDVEAAGFRAAGKAAGREG
jgi:transcriptional regulator of acetoin/glycerol metabolism